MTSDEVLIFVDGENLVLRYQEMLKAGRRPAPDNVHVADSFIWNQRVLNDHIWNLKRVSYYTSVVGDDQKLRRVREEIAATSFTCRTGVVAGFGPNYTTRTGQIVPFVRKKATKSRKESVCDITIAVDVMRACYRDHAKTIWIFSGDGDFLSLFNEVVHNGKLAYASAFSSGLNGDLRYAVDEFLPLDKYFFLEDAPVQSSPPDAEGSAKPDA
jgi:uncharacterized LabA/DUF88 family protein